MKKFWFIILVIASLSFTQTKKVLLLDKNGNPVPLPQDKIILLNFMAYTCGYCMAEIPTIKKVLQEKEFKDKVVVIAFALDGKENNFKDKDFPIYANNPKNQVIFPIMGTPTTYIINSSGKKLAIIYGALTEENLRKYLREAISKNASGRI
ncbi:MAG TPA: TlpA family protein disulfide reductase [Sulfurihydrogenibium azorense]|uniref:TlpA family protein disulfide reductase n=1 Tax=Sulfurihydrogenibium azorense TaxID=309806 RepID=A0A831YDW0_9AQUI|nr:MAG: TlpA family protein disulfide reductase [Sulfurihydrogenibium sp.]HEV09254.1 TlpA family protein disulfide reductase [Sulfurihydrogenibium azorense]